MAPFVPDVREANPAEDLAAGLADHLIRWAEAIGAPARTLPRLAAAGRALSLATNNGDVCVDLVELAAELAGDSPATLAEQLLASGLVATAGDDQVLPLVLDADGRLYLYRYFAYERQLAASLVQRARGSLPASSERLQAALAEVFAPPADRSRQRADWQKIAAALACRRRLTILSGGPGTGKTTTVVGVLACLLADNPNLRVGLAAPTGKAAARLLDALRRRASQLSPHLQARLPDAAHTVHRLLGVTPESGRFRHHRDRPLPLDVLIVDEASMLDLALACRLCDAVRPDARLILVGDKDQLAAVEAGAVFAELSADPTLSRECVAELATLCATPPAQIVPPAPAASTPLPDCVVWLQESHRFSADSELGQLAKAINAGRGDVVCERLGAAGDGSLRWLPDDLPTLAPPTMAALSEGYRPYLQALQSDAADRLAWRHAVFAAFERFRVLCAVRDTARGVRAINRALDSYVQRVLGVTAEDSSPGYLGRPLIVARNDYLLKLFNGDVGLCLPDDSGTLMAWFPIAGGDFRPLALLRLPEHETAWAMTVHKAQGSEFEAITLLLPQRAQRVVTRELLYTGVTRATTSVTLIGSRDVVLDACANPTRRHSGLIARLDECTP